MPSATTLPPPPPPPRCARVCVRAPLLLLLSDPNPYLLLSSGQLRPTLLTTLLTMRALCRSGMPSKAVELYANAVSSIGALPVDFFDAACDMFGTASNLPALMAVLRHMADRSISPSPHTIAAVIKASAASGHHTLVRT